MSFELMANWKELPKIRALKSDVLSPATRIDMPRGRDRAPGLARRCITTFLSMANISSIRFLLLFLVVFLIYPPFAFAKPEIDPLIHPLDKIELYAAAEFHHNEKWRFQYLSEEGKRRDKLIFGDGWVLKLSKVVGRRTGHAGSIYSRKMAPQYTIGRKNQNLLRGQG